MSAKYDWYKPWTLEDIPKSRKENAVAWGCEEDVLYVGDPDADDCMEVPSCPICDDICWADDKCEHYAFIWDINAGYTDINPKFKDYALQVVLQKLSSLEADDRKIAAEAVNKGELPNAAFLEQIINGLKTVFRGSYHGDRGIEYGFINYDSLGKEP